jgi:hypothetical protein
MRSASSVAMLVGVAALASGCALVAGYDFGKYGERAGAGGDASSSTGGGESASTAGGSMSVGSTSTGTGVLTTTVLYSGPDIPSRLAVDAAAVYFTASPAMKSPDGKVLRVTKDGSSLIKLVITETDPFSLAVTATHAYWSSGDINQEVIKRAPNLGGGAVELISDVMEAVGAITAHGQQIYWTTPSSDAIWTKGPSDGFASQLITGQTNPSEILVDATGVYWLNKGTSNQSDGSVMRADLDGMNAKALATGQRFPLNMALDAGHVYWTTLDGELSGIGKDGKNLFFYVAPDPKPGNPITGIASDGTHVYYILDNKVFKVAVGSLSAEAILNDGNYPKDIAVDEGGLYVAEAGSNGPSMVLKLSK